MFSIILIIVFEGETEHLIPLYAVGVFIPFTLAQLGMMIKWMREKPKGWTSKLIINSLGALISLIVTIVFFLTKFTQVWPVLVFLPIIIYLFHSIHRHYEAIADQLRISPNEPTIQIEGNVIIVPVAGITRVVQKSLNYAKSLSAQQIIAVYVSFDKEDEKKLEQKWDKWQTGVRLVTLLSIQKY